MPNDADHTRETNRSWAIGRYADIDHLFDQREERYTNHWAIYTKLSFGRLSILGESDK